jgi:hypothetical protein
LFILLFHIWVGLALKLQTFGVVYPVGPLAPCLLVAVLSEDLLQLGLDAGDVMIITVDDQVIVFGEDGDQAVVLVGGWPGQLFDELEQFVLV